MLRRRSCFTPTKAAWAPSKGLTGSDFKANWDVDLGVTYIPWDSLADVDLDELSEGGVIDDDTLPEHMKSACFSLTLHSYTLTTRSRVSKHSGARK